VDNCKHRKDSADGHEGSDSPISAAKEQRTGQEGSCGCVSCIMVSKALDCWVTGNAEHGED